MKKTRHIIIAVVVLALVSMSCICGLTEKLTNVVDEVGNETGEIDFEVPESESEGMPEGTAPEDEAEDPGPGQGDRLENMEGGFSIIVPKDFTEESFWGLTSMQGPDFTEEAGPLFLAIGGPNEEPQTLDELYDSYISDASEELTVTNQREIKVAGYPAYEVDMAGAPDGVDIVGKYTLVSVGPNQYFLLAGFAEPDRWKKEFAPIYKKVIKSVEFFEPVEEEFE